MIQIKWEILIYTTHIPRKWDRAVGSANSYWSDSPGFESYYGKQISCTPEPLSLALGPASTPM